MIQLILHFDILQKRIKNTANCKIAAKIEVNIILNFRTIDRILIGQYYRCIASW